MRIAFLLATVHDLGGTAGAVVTQANNLVSGLGGGHDVEILSLYRTSERQHFPLDPRVVVRDLVDLTGEQVRVAGCGLDQETLRRLREAPPRLLPDHADPNLDALADVALEAALPGLEADVLVTVIPAMLAYAVRLAPARVAVVHQEHRSSAQRPHGRELLLDHARSADVVAMLTEPMAAWLTAELGPESPRVVVVPNALAPGFRPRSPLTEPVILGAGRLMGEKQWPHLVSAFGRIADRVPDWRLRIFGEGHARFDVLALSRRLGLWDRVELPGPTTDMTSEWARASISALTSQPGEGFPLVIQEAMAAGVPVVAYDMPSGPRDQIDDGVDGLLVTAGSEAGLAAGLLRLATDADERRRMGAAARAKAATWDSASITARWGEVYAEAVERRAALVATGAGRAGTALALGPAPAAPDPDVAPAGREGAGLTPEQARSTTLAAVAALAGRLGGAWFVVPPRGGEQAVVVLPVELRRGFLAALAAPGALPDFVSVHDPEHRGWPSRRGPAAEQVPHLLRARTPRLLLEPWPRAGEHGSLLAGCGVTVEFWERGPDGDLHAPGRASHASVVPAAGLGPGATTTVRVHDVEVLTLPLMALPTPYECRFEVDVVYTWVDGRDPAWDAAREARLAALTDDGTVRTRAASGRARYVDRGELRYSLRSIHLFAPWVRRIHLVTAGQVPPWLDTDDPRLHLVDHRDLLPPEALPTFSSHAIESVLHRIDGLSEHFLYLNDDFFLARPTWPEQWFSPAGATAVFPSSLTVGLPGQEELPYARAAANNRRLLQEAFGVATLHTLVHAPYAHRVSVLTEIADRFADAVDATTRAPFRSATDVSMLSSLAQHYGLLTGTAYVGSIDAAFVDLADVAVRRRLRDLLARDRTCFCLGDAHDFARDPEKVDAMVRDFLETYYPLAAPWER